MTNDEYVRSSAAKFGWIKYYSILRPVSIGTQPKQGFMDFINYSEKTNEAWAELYYNRELTVEEMEQYELVKGE